MPLVWLPDWSCSLDGLRDFIAAGIQSFRDCDGGALLAVGCLLLLFVWYCYHVGREQPRAYPAVNALMQGAEANGVQNSFVYCHAPECARCSPHDGLNQKLYHNLQEYAKRYSWSGMGRIHKGIREQGRYLNSRPSIQKPEVFFLPDLPTAPYFSRDAQKHDVEVLERNFQTILCEFESLYKAFSNCSLPQGWKMNSTPSGEWFTFYLVNQGMCVPRNCRRCPRTYRLLGSLRTCIGNNVFGNACISVLSPGTVIAEHYGPTNIRIRCHLGECPAGGRSVGYPCSRAVYSGCPSPIPGLVLAPLDVAVSPDWGQVPPWCQPRGRDRATCRWLWVSPRCSQPHGCWGEPMRHRWWRGRHRTGAAGKQ